jgi:hypothetical protein
MGHAAPACGERYAECALACGCARTATAWRGLQRVGSGRNLSTTSPEGSRRDSARARKVAWTGSQRGSMAAEEVEFTSSRPRTAVGGRGGRCSAGALHDRKEVRCAPQQGKGNETS